MKILLEKYQVINSKKSGNKNILIISKLKMLWARSPTRLLINVAKNMMNWIEIAVKWNNGL